MCGALWCLWTRWPLIELGRRALVIELLWWWALVEAALGVLALLGWWPALELLIGVEVGIELGVIPTVLGWPARPTTKLWVVVKVTHC